MPVSDQVLLELFGDRVAPDGSFVRENFRKWFGDSVAVDASGRPLVLCHGTTSAIEQLDLGKTVDGGLHLGSPGQAAMRAHPSGRSLLPCFVRILNPRRSRDAGGNWKAKIASAKASGHDGIVYLNRYEGLTTEVIQRLERAGTLSKLDGMSDAEFRRAVPEAHDSYIAFLPSQVKSAVGNSGFFHLHSDDITDAVAELSLSAAVGVTPPRRRARP